MKTKINHRAWKSLAAIVALLALSVFTTIAAGPKRHTTSSSAQFKSKADAGSRGDKPTVDAAISPKITTGGSTGTLYGLLNVFGMPDANQIFQMETPTAIAVVRPPAYNGWYFGNGLNDTWSFTTFRPDTGSTSARPMSLNRVLPWDLAIAGLASGPAPFAVDAALHLTTPKRFLQISAGKSWIKMMEGNNK